jgi:uncharacterized membrane-anchored protein YitT (DUF2179 family)
MKKTKKIVLETLFRCFVVIASSLIYVLAVEWFIEPAGLVSIGLTGLSQLLQRLFILINIDLPIGLYNFFLNVPLLIYGFFKVSRKFVLYTALSVVVQSVLLLGWIPEVNLEVNILFFAIIGGLFAGVGIGGALYFGVSTGGFDVLGQALNLKKGISIGTITMAINITLAIVCGGILEGSWELTLYTFIYIIILSLVVDKIHTAYRYVRIDVISIKSEEVSTALIQGINRGCTILDVKGAYTHENKYDVFMVISSYELEKAKKIIYEVDPAAFIMVMPVNKIIGAFYKRTIL